MDEKKALEAAAKRLRCEPGDFMAWGWRGERLVVIAPTGQKFVFEPEKLVDAKQDNAQKKAGRRGSATTGTTKAKKSTTARAKQARQPAVKDTPVVKNSPVVKNTTRPASTQSKRS